MNKKKFMCVDKNKPTLFHKTGHLNIVPVSPFLEQCTNSHKTDQNIFGEGKENQKLPNLVSPHKNIKILNEFMRIFFSKRR